jgi:hypothetical protein
MGLRLSAPRPNGCHRLRGADSSPQGSVCSSFGNITCLQTRELSKYAAVDHARRTCRCCRASKCDPLKEPPANTAHTVRAFLVWRRASAVTAVPGPSRAHRTPLQGTLGTSRRASCVPRFKFALRDAFASTSDRAQTDQQRRASSECPIYMEQPRCGFVFKIAISI